MDRREMMEIVATTIGAIKVKADISTIDATPKPLLIVVTRSMTARFRKKTSQSA